MKPTKLLLAAMIPFAGSALFAATVFGPLGGPEFSETATTFAWGVAHKAIEADEIHLLPTTGTSSWGGGTTITEKEGPGTAKDTLKIVTTWRHLVAPHPGEPPTGPAVSASIDIKAGVAPFTTGKTRFARKGVALHGNHRDMIVMSGYVVVRNNRDIDSYLVIVKGKHCDDAKGTKCMMLPQNGGFPNEDIAGACSVVVDPGGEQFGLSLGVSDLQPQDVFDIQLVSGTPQNPGPPILPIDPIDLVDMHGLGVWMGIDGPLPPQHIPDLLNDNAFLLMNTPWGQLVGQFESSPFFDPYTYCTAKSGLVCGPAEMFHQGIPQAGATSGFIVGAAPARGMKSGLFLYGNTGRATIPFDGGLLCLAPPLRRADPVGTGGTPGQCDGILAIDMNAFASGALGGNPDPFLQLPGTTVDGQWWGRDSLQTGSFLSDGIEFIMH